MELVPLCRDVASSACSSGLVLAQIKGTRVSHPGGSSTTLSTFQCRRSRVRYPLLFGEWEGIAEAIQLVPHEEVFLGIGEQIVDGTERGGELIVAPRSQVSERVVEQIAQTLFTRCWNASWSRS